MVLGLLGAIIAVPAIVGTTEAIRQGQHANAKEEHRGRKANLVVNLPKPNRYSQAFDGAPVVLRNKKVTCLAYCYRHACNILTTSSQLYIDTNATTLGSGVTPGHPFAGYYYPYPANQNRWRAAGLKGEGMVSTISDDPPMLNWIYVDAQTHEIKYGVRVEAEPHHCGPWDCTAVEKRVTFEGWEGFVAVQEDEDADEWALYFDRDDNGLRGAGMVGLEDRRMLEVEVRRKERKKVREVALEEKDARLRSMAEQENNVTA